MKVDVCPEGAVARLRADINFHKSSTGKRYTGIRVSPSDIVRWGLSFSSPKRGLGISRSTPSGGSTGPLSLRRQLMYRSSSLAIIYLLYIRPCGPRSLPSHLKHLSINTSYSVSLSHQLCLSQSHHTCLNSYTLTYRPITSRAAARRRSPTGWFSPAQH